MKCIGKGNTAEVFDYQEQKICKLFYEGYPKQSIEKEYKNATKLSALGIRVPKCYGEIEMMGRQGILYEAVQGKTLMAYFTQTQDEVFLITQLVGVHKALLQHQVEDIPYYKDFLLDLVAKAEEPQDEWIERIQQLPDGNTLCHGDFHPHNMMVGEDQTIFVIDLMNVCKGPWLYDVARTYFLISADELPETLENKAQILQMKQQLAETYLEHMNVQLTDIQDFLKVIQACRKYE